MRQEQIQLVPNGTAAASFTSNAISARELLSCSVQANGTGAGAAGTMKLQASNDPDSIAGNAQPSNWTDIPSATATIAGATSVMIPKTDLCYEWVRVVYTNTGTGTVGISFKALGL